MRATPAQWKVAWRYVEAKFSKAKGGRRNTASRSTDASPYAPTRPAAKPLRPPTPARLRRANGHDDHSEERQRS